MKTEDVNLRVSATCHLNVDVGDEIRRGDSLCTSPDSQEKQTAPVSGIVKDIQFDPGNHEFVIQIHPSSETGPQHS